MQARIVSLAVAAATLSGAVLADGITHTDRLIVKYRTDRVSAQSVGTHLQSAQTLAANLGHRLSALRAMHSGAQVLQLEGKLPVDEVAKVAAALKAANPAIEYAEPDRLMKPLMTPNDSMFNQQWEYFEATGGMNITSAWDKATGQGVRVAVLDTGYRPHADLAANIIGGYDFISDAKIGNDGDGRDSSALDPGDAVKAGECGGGQPTADQGSSWHGTHVAGTIAAVANNGAGIAGIAFNAKVVPVRVLGKCGGYTSDIADAIVWASGGTVSGVPANPYPAKLINMSLGGGGACDTTTQNAINIARANGTAVIVAAGNENQNASNSNPANCQGVITVAATNRQGGRAYYSNYGSVVTLAAPGGAMSSATDPNGILSTLNAGTTSPGADNYAFYQGTSMATPHVVGAAALVLSVNPNLTPDQLKNLLVSTVRPFPATCSGCGAGIVDAAAAVNAALGGSGGGTPTPTPTTVAEVESNNTLTAAQKIITSGTTVAGTLSSSTDVDYYSVQLPAGQTLTATLTPNSTSDYDLYVYNSNGTQIGSSTNGTGLTDTVSVKNTGTSTFTRYIKVVYYSGGTGSTNGKYSLKLSWK